MPKGKGHKVYKAMRRKGASKGKAARIAHATVKKTSGKKY